MNFKLYQEKTFKIKLMLDILFTIPHFHIVYPNIFLDINCIIYKNHKGYTYWLICPDLLDLKLTITNTIQKFFYSSKLDITTVQLHELYYNYQCFSPNQ